MADTELLPCPFCKNADLCAEMGSTPSPGDYIMCDGPDGCGAMILRVDTQDDDLVGAWNRRATPPSPSTAPEVDERHEFGRWMSQRGESAVYIGDGLYSTGAVCDQAEAFAAGIAIGLAALASRPAEVDGEGLPGLPDPAGTIPMYADDAEGTQTHEVDGYTAEQYRQGQRDAVAADRARRQVDGK